uniref:PB2 protein n=1 Tax=Isavirus salaris TaxID=55987 RepID=Q2TJK9_9ORTO|nr:PB2 protein [Infectious salmon anemia virus]
MDFISENTISDKTTLEELKNATLFQVTKVDDRDCLKARRICNAPKGHWSGLIDKAKTIGDPTEEEKEELKKIVESYNTVTVLGVSKSEGATGPRLVSSLKGLKNLLPGVNPKTLQETLLVGAPCPSTEPATEEYWNVCRAAVGASMGSAKINMSQKVVMGASVIGWGQLNQSGTGVYFLNTKEIVTAEGKVDETRGPLERTSAPLMRDISRLIQETIEEVETGGDPSFSVRSEGGSKIKGRIAFSLHSEVSTLKMRIALEQKLARYEYMGENLLTLVKNTSIDRMQPDSAMMGKMVLESLRTHTVSSEQLNGRMITVQSQGLETIAISSPFDVEYDDGYVFTRMKGDFVAIGRDYKGAILCFREGQGTFFSGRGNWSGLMERCLVEMRLCPCFYSCTWQDYPDKKSLYEKATFEAKQIVFAMGESVGVDVRVNTDGEIGDKGISLLTREREDKYMSKVSYECRVVSGKLVMGLDKMSRVAKGNLEVVREKGDDTSQSDSFYEGVLQVGSMIGTTMESLKQQLQGPVGIWRASGVSAMERCMKRGQSKTVVASARYTFQKMMEKMASGREVSKYSLIIVMRCCIGFTSEANKRALTNISGTGYYISVAQPTVVKLAGEWLITPVGRSKTGEVQYVSAKLKKGMTTGKLELIKKADRSDLDNFPEPSADELLREGTIVLMQIGKDKWLCRVRTGDRRVRTDTDIQRAEAKSQVEKEDLMDEYGV